MSNSRYRLVPASTGAYVRTYVNSVDGFDVETQAVKSFLALGDDGSLLDLDSWAHTLAYNADGTLNYDEVTDGTNSWRQTMTWSSGNLTGTSAWVLQP